MLRSRESAANAALEVREAAARRSREEFMRG
jgi:hypothetical protein